jgi:hypothetical protein
VINADKSYHLMFWQCSLQVPVLSAVIAMQICFFRVKGSSPYQNCIRVNPRPRELPGQNLFCWRQCGEESARGHR